MFSSNDVSYYNENVVLSNTTVRKLKIVTFMFALSVIFVGTVYIRYIFYT